MTTKKILLIHTGGTIGMQASERGYIPVSGFAQLITERLSHSHHAALPDFDIIELHPLIDSANLHPDHWNTLAEQVIRQYEKYDGFVILHGTDTMAYSASMLSFMLQGLGKPVIFTGSQIPLSELRNDALDNLITAMLLAGFHPVNEVCVYFNGRLLRGNRCCKVKATGLDAFDSPNFPWLGQAGLHIELHPRLFLAPRSPQFQNPTFNSQAVAILPIYPGINAQSVAALISNTDVKAVILRSYGVGNLPDENSEFIEVLSQAAGRGILFFNISQCIQADIIQGQYACSTVLNEIGVISGAEMTVEAAFCKLHYLLATCQNPAEIRQQLGINLVGEIDTP